MEPMGAGPQKWEKVFTGPVTIDKTNKTTAKQVQAKFSISGGKTAL